MTHPSDNWPASSGKALTGKPDMPIDTHAAGAAIEGHFPNYAGRSDRDDEIAAELEAAGIKVHRFESLRNQGEVKTSVMGEMTGWSFRRAWYYWVAEGNGIELAAAERLHAKHPKTVRVEGHCGCPSPREWCKGLAVGSYHVDSPEGLKGLADTIRELTGPATASPAPGALADLRARIVKERDLWMNGRLASDKARTLNQVLAWMDEADLLASSPAASAPPVDGGGRERIESAIYAHVYTSSPDVFALQGVDEAVDAILSDPRPAAGAAGLVEALSKIRARTYSADRGCALHAEAVADISDIAGAALARHATPDGEKTEAGDAMLTALHSEIAHSVTCPADPALSGLAEASNRMAGRWLRRDPMAPIERSVQVSAKKASNRILLHSGNCFDLLAPEASTFTIEDIAHGLSNVCRFAGQCTRFYSVAQHSVLVSQHVPPEHAYAGLMHDAAEALIGDVSKPLKEILPDYQALEKRIEAAVCSRFDVPYPLSEEVKRIDMIMLATEQHLLMPDREGRSFAGGHTPLDIDIPLLWPHEAEALFLRRYAELRGHELPAITRSDIPQGEARARIGGRVPEHVYLDGKPLFTAASAEQAAEVVALLNATPQGAGETAGGDLVGEKAKAMCADHCTDGKEGPCDECTADREHDWRREAEAALATAAPEQAGSRGLSQAEISHLARVMASALAEHEDGKPVFAIGVGALEHAVIAVLAAARPHSDAEGRS